MPKLFFIITLFFSFISYSQTLRLSGDKNIDTIKTSLCVDCVLPKSLKSCNFTFKWRVNNSFMVIRYLHSTNLWFCCTCHNEDTFPRHRDENVNNHCLRIFKRFHVNTKYVMEWNGEKRYTLQKVLSTNNRRITKTSSHIRRKLLMHKNGNESNYSRFYSTIKKNQQGHFEWEASFQNVVLQCLILVVMMFTFFAIIIAMMWLCSMYVLKRLKRQKNAFQPNLCLDITEF